MAGSWEYEARRERRRKQIMALQEAASRTLEPLQRGDVTAARRALKQEQYEQEEDPWANVPERDIPDTGPVRQFSPGMEKAALQAANFVGRTNPLAFSPDVPEREADGGSSYGLKDLGKDLVKKPLKALEWADKAGNYTLRPAVGLASGLTRTPREPIYDDKGNIVGYARDPGLGDWPGQFVGGIKEAFTQSPRRTIRENRQAFEEYQQNPENSPGWQIAASGATDPLSFVGPGVVKAGLRFAPLAVRTSKLTRLGANLIESPSRASGLGIVGAATGGQIAENEEWGPGASMAAMLGGGLLGGGLGGIKKLPRPGDILRGEAPVSAMVFRKGAPEGTQGPYAGRRVVPESIAASMPDPETQQLYYRYKALHDQRVALLRKGEKDGLTDAEKQQAAVLYTQRDAIGQQLAARGVQYSTGMGTTLSGSPQPLANERLWFHSTQDLNYDLPDPDLAVGTQTGITQGPGVYLAADPSKSAGRYGNRTFVTEFDGNVLDLTKTVGPEELAVWQRVKDAVEGRLNKSLGEVYDPSDLDFFASKKTSQLARADNSYAYRDALVDAVRGELDQQLRYGVGSFMNEWAKLAGRFKDVTKKGQSGDVAKAIVADVMAEQGIDAVFHHSPRADGDVLIVLNGDSARVLGDIKNQSSALLTGKTWQDIKGALPSARGTGKTRYISREVGTGSGKWGVFDLQEDDWIYGNLDSAEEAMRVAEVANLKDLGQNPSTIYGLTGQQGRGRDVLRESFRGGAARTGAQVLASGAYGATQDEDNPWAGFLTGAAQGASRAALPSGGTLGVIQRATQAASPAGIAPALTAEDAAMGLPDLEGVTIFNLPEITPKPLTKTDHVMNEVVHSVTGKAREEPIATTAMRERERLKHVVDSTANGLALKTTALAHRAFKFDKQERIVDLPGQPTLSVLAARLPDFLPHMSIAQREAISQIQREIEPFINLLRLKGIDFGTRPDIIEGGFYLPRGSAEKAGMKKVAGAARGRRGRSGYRQHAKYESMMDAMEANWEYKSFPEAMQALGRQVGMDAVNKHIEDYFKNVATPEGFKIGSTATERMNPVVRAKWKDVTARVVSARARLITAEKRAKVATTAADEVDDAIQRFEEGIPDEGTRNISKIGEKLETEAMRGEKLRERADVLRGPKDVPAGAKPRIVMLSTMSKAERDALLKTLPLESEIDEITGPYLALGSTGSRGTLYTVRGQPVSQVRYPETTARPASAAETRRAELVDGKAAELERVVASIEKNVPDDVDKLANIETALRRSIKRAETLAARGDEYSDEALSLRDELDLLSDEIDALRPEYKVALDNARSPAHYEGGIGGPGTALSGLQGYGFPEEVAAAANKYLDKELKQKSVQGAVMAFNQLMRGLKATLDVSFIGIQGALGAARDPIGFGAAQAVAWKSMADSDALGKYLLNFDQRAKAQGRPTSAQWQAAGLRTGGSATEFQIGSEGVGRLSDAIARKPGVRHSNRMFGNFGDVMRMELAHHAYGSANGFTTAGLGKFDLTDPKSLESLADAANRATGWSRSRAGGDLGELILFAPRFFQSQLEFLTQAAGVHGGNTPGAWEARRTLVSFLGVGVGLSVLANEMADELGGEKIPWEEFWDPRTSNFLRFRIAGQDTTIFGPWDSLVRSMVRTAQGLPGVPGEGDPTYILRSKASPAVNLAWGLITDENAIGRENFRSPGNIIKELVVPFSLSDSDVLGGEQTANQTTLGAFGIKSTPVTPKEEFDRLARAEYGMNYYDLAPREQHAMKKAHPEMWERVVEKGNKLRIQGEEVKQRYVSEQEARDADLLSGKLSVEQWEEARDDAYSRKDGEMSQIYKDSDYEGKDARLNDYFAAADSWTRNGVFDFEARNAYIEGLSEDDQKYLEENTGLNATPLEKLRKRLSGEYYELPRYRGYTADEARQIDEIWQEIRNNARNAETGSMLIAKRKSGVDIERYGKRVRKGVMGRILGWLSLDNDREKYLKKNPAARVLISARGNLTPAMVEAVEAEL